MSGRKARFTSSASRSASAKSAWRNCSDENQKLSDQLAMLRSPVMLDQRVRELNLGLVPAQPTQVWRLAEPSPCRRERNSTRRFAARQAGATDAIT